MERFIVAMGYNVISMKDGKEVIDFFSGKETYKGIRPSDVSIMLLDLSMPRMDGLSVLKKISSIRGDLNIVVLSASNEITYAISAINLGAMDYIVKGDKDMFPRINTAINSAIEKRTLQQQVYHLECKNSHQISFSDLTGSSQAFVSTINLAKKASNSNVSILVEGGTGTGKELLARAIHGSGSKSGKLFIEVDCENFHSDDADVILFGSEKFLEGGVKEKITGKIKEADGGTLFLNNIDALSRDLQIKLLKFMQEGILEQRSGRAILKQGVRVISSTNQDLKNCIKHKKFREDLYYCLTVFPIEMPSLFERGEKDITTLSNNFCRDFSVNENKPIKGIDPSAMEILCRFGWEDNIRQLRNYIFRAVTLCEGDFLLPEHFPQIIHSNLNQDPAGSSYKGSSKKICAIDLFDNGGRCKNLEEVEIEVFKKLLECFDGNLSEVSKQLRVGRSTIYRKLSNQ
ncbi:MAG: DNA-binding NtrC family response regulator [Lentimonas sp.]|jgi:DNA-binding NtrC family response regulator